MFGIKQLQSRLVVLPSELALHGAHIHIDLQCARRGAPATSAIADGVCYAVLQRFAKLHLADAGWVFEWRGRIPSSMLHILLLVHQLGSSHQVDLILGFFVGLAITIPAAQGQVLAVCLKMAACALARTTQLPQDVCASPPFGTASTTLAIAPTDFDDAMDL